MPSIQQVKKPAVIIIFLGLCLLQTILQLHMTQRYNEENSFTSSSQAYRLKRSAFSTEASASNISEINESLLPPAGANGETSSTSMISVDKNDSNVVSSSPSSSSTILQSLFKISSSSSPSILINSNNKNEETLESKHVTDWSDIPSNLFLHHFYSGNFSYPNSELCSNKPNLTLFILVATGIKNFEKRKSVRQTWGHYGLRSDVQFAFVIGDSLFDKYDPKLRRELDKEMGIYNDFIIGSFPDTYRNLTLKTLHMLDWISTHCPGVPYFLKTDDDVFLNVPQLLSLIHKIKKEDSEVPKIYGHIFSGHYPERNPAHRHMVPYNVYPHNLTFPNFTSGPAYLMSTKLAQPILTEALKLPFIPLEDVLTTGFAAMNLGIPRVDFPGFLNEMKNPATLPACEIIKIFAGMTDGSPTQMSYVWFNYMMGRNLCVWRRKPYLIV